MIIVAAVLLLIISFVYSALTGAGTPAQKGFSSVVPVSWTLYGGEPLRFSFVLQNKASEELAVDFSSTFFKLSRTGCSVSLARVESVKDESGGFLVPVEGARYSLAPSAKVVVSGYVEQASKDQCTAPAGQTFRFQLSMLSISRSSGQNVPETGTVSGRLA